MGSEFLVHGHFAPLFWDCGEAAHDGRVHVSRKEREQARERDWEQNTAFKGHAPSDLISPARSHLLKFPIAHQAVNSNPSMRSEPSRSNHFPKVPSLNAIALGTRPTTNETLGDIPDTNHNRKTPEIASVPSFHL